MSASIKLQVHLIDLDNITKNTLNYYFNSSLCTNAILCKFSEGAELLIVDLDRSVASDLWKTLREDNQYAIVLHKQEDEFINEEKLIGLAKPIQQNRLKEIVDTIFNRIKKSEAGSASEVVSITSSDSNNINTSLGNNNNSNLTPNTPTFNKNASTNNQMNSDINSHQRFKLRAYVGSNADIDLNNSSNSSHIYITPDKYLYHHLAKAIKMGKLSKSDVLIKTSSGRILYENSSQQFYSFNWSKLKHAQAKPIFDDTTLTQINSNSELSQGGTAVDAVEIVWESALLASKGRLPKDTSLNNIVEIIYWPDFSKLSTFKYADQIATAWSIKPMSINATATELKIPQRYVFALFCAMQAINSARIEKESKIDNVKRLDEASKKDMFSKILGSFISNR